MLRSEHIIFILFYIKYEKLLRRRKLITSNVRIIIIIIIIIIIVIIILIPYIGYTELRRDRRLEMEKGLS
jgi:hypothetical protein